MALLTRHKIPAVRQKPGGGYLKSFLYIHLAV
jgi:hypothetical protein